MANCRSLKPANADEMATSHDEDPRVKYSKKRAFAELLGMCKKVCEWVHDREEGEEFKNLLQRWQPQEEGERRQKEWMVSTLGLLEILLLRRDLERIGRWSRGSSASPTARR